ncbi:helix-turn-helix domain-containing protein [Robbsia andropogonis]|uniref:helix-turn-helix domain-containing protein n=1 Tax=Robbsia andropogonis TaxID=28092 RepID=UPI00209CC0DD|nr:helix-turn-helix domain-containing protein [Robbsia andropogonis]MCP1116924.1 helix-turn-helix domain-containing protein [Robbsia andropogonis]MCP1126397.1 helix-turn-helix domain-containing protein [Robbsia andropogonis]
MESPHARLREERLRIGVSQEEFAAVGGVSRLTQRRYENGDRDPDMAYLSAAYSIGVDVLYVLTGHRALDTDGQTKHLASDERDLLEDFRKMNEAGKASVQAFVATCLSASALTVDGQPQRARRLVENRRAALDDRTNENIDRALALVKVSRAECPSKPDDEEVGAALDISNKRAKRGVENRRAGLDKHTANVVDRAVNARKQKEIDDDFTKNR